MSAPAGPAPGPDGPVRAVAGATDDRAHPYSAAADFADRLVRAFVDRGVRHAVLSPGSRSQALALALAALDEQGVIRLHVRIDERVAAFTALGLARESGVPALVVTTSGTAVANLLPGVVEASHSGVPLIVLSADRPAALRGTGANQTTWQPGIFGRFVRAERDVAAPRPGALPDAAEFAGWAIATALDASAPGAPAGQARGPVHLNLQFVEPLSGPTTPSVPAIPTGAPAAELPASATPSSPLGASVHLGAGPRTLVVAGADAGERANAFSLHTGWPLIAEVSSGARFGPTLVASYRTLLDHPDFGGRVERVVLFGHPTLSRQVPALLARKDVELVVVTAAGEPVRPRPDAILTAEVSADPEDRGDRAARAWTGQWVFAGRELAAEEGADDEVAAPVIVEGSTDIAGSRDYAKTELAALNAPVSRRALALAVWKASWPHDRLVLGASRLVRELDAAAGGKRIAVHANRGLAGIDGTVATAIGIALASQDPRTNAGRVGTTRLLLGDLTLLHDVGALLLPADEPAPRLQIVVGNDGGGSIFDRLEVAYTAERAAFDRVLFTPQRVDLAALAAAYGWTHRRVDRRGELDSALASPAPGPSIVEVALAR